MSANAELVELGDLDELVRHTDRLVAAGAWDELLDLRRRCRLALERGRQLWPVSSLVEYLLALEAPAAWAGAVLEEGAGHLGLGPLSEVAACRHRWHDLGPHVPAGPMRALVAHECVVRGEAVADDVAAGRSVDPGPPDPLGLPLALQPWEPAYPVAEYGPDRLEAPRPALPATRPVPARPPGAVVDEPVAVDALRGVVRPWVTGSDGRAEAVAVAGGAVEAVAALGPPRMRLAELDPASALALVAWAGASGGAHGRRRGAAAGRFEAWWLVAALAGLADDWPLDAEEVGAVAAELRWFVWDADEPDTGWHLRLAVEDPAEHLAFALGAIDTP